MSKPILHLIGGIPESGKTRLRKLISGNYDKAFIFDDNEEFLLACKKENMPLSKGLKELLPDIQKRLHDQLQEATKNGEPILVERTLISVQGRIRFTQMNALKDYKTRMSFLLPPINEEEVVLLERIKNRKSKMAFTEAGYKELLSIMQVPNTAEGLSFVEYFDIYQNMVEYNNEFEPDSILVN